MEHVTDLGDPTQPAAARRRVDHDETIRANQSWWDTEAPAYYAEHGGFLGDSDLVWGPEGWTEEEFRLLGDVAGRDVLEIGAGAAQGSRYLARRGARVVATDLSGGMLRQARAIDVRRQDRPIPLVQCDACRLPFADASVDLAFTAYGAIPFVADSAGLLREVRRVLRPGGTFVFSTTHPMRWVFPDDPGEAGLVATTSYFDRTPYVEEDHVPGEASYVEHHRTMGDRVRDIVAAELLLVDIVEPAWPERNGATWGGWSPLRGAIMPGTAIFVCRRP